VAVATSRATVGVAAAVLVENTVNASASDNATRSYLLIPQVDVGTVVLGPPGGGGALTTANGARWNLASGPLSIDLEPGEQLTAIVASGTVAVDIVSAGR
jgi:hypothetical protein